MTAQNERSGPVFGELARDAALGRTAVRGTQCVVKQPARKRGPERTEGQVVGTGPGGSGRSLRDMRLLVIEDHVDTLEALTTVLELEGAEVTGAGTVAEALAQVGRMLRHVPPAAILCDIDLPDGDGYDFLAQFRALESGRGDRAIPVLAVTAHAEQWHRERALAAGFAVYLAKPVDPIVLIAQLAKFDPRR